MSKAFAPFLTSVKAIAGWFADRTSSRRMPYLLGLVALVISTLAFSLGRSTIVLFIGRLIQGASSAAVHTVGLAILADTVGKDGIGPAMGFVGMSVALGVVLGPVLGGILYHQLGYLAVFGSAYALVGLDFLFRVFMVTGKIGEAKRPVIKPDSQNYGTISNNVTSPGASSPLDSQGALSRSDSRSSRRTSSTASTVDSTNSLDFSMSPQPAYSNQKLPNTQRHPIKVLLTSSRMLAALLADFIQSLILTGLESILPLRIKTMFDYNSMQVALVFLALSVASFAGPAVGHISDRFGAKIMVCLGFLYCAPLLILLRLIEHEGSNMVVLLCCLLLLLGIALNMILTPAWSDVSYLVDDMMREEPGIFGAKGAYAQAFGLMNVAYAAGSLVGPLLGGLLVETVGWNDLTLATGILCALCILPCLYATGGRRRQKGSDGQGGENRGS